MYGGLIGKKTINRISAANDEEKRANELENQRERRNRRSGRRRRRRKGNMPKVYFKFVSFMNLLNSNSILTAIVTLLILQVGQNRIWLVNSSTLPTPYPDANARPTITSKLEIYKNDLHKTTVPNVTATTEGYLPIFSGNDSYGKSNPPLFCPPHKKHHTHALSISFAT